jgi:hypothetical protein
VEFSVGEWQDKVETSHNECIFLPSCKHQFHAHCLDTWLQHALASELSWRCPLCRRGVERKVRPHINTGESRELSKSERAQIAYDYWRIAHTVSCVVGLLFLAVIVFMMYRH